MKDIPTVASEHTHGLRDNNRYENGELINDKSDQRLNKLKDGCLICHCRYVSRTIVDYYRRHGYDARVIEFISAKDGEDDLRHTVAEVYLSDCPTLVDVDMGVMFCRGYWLRAIDVYRELKPDDVVWLVEDKCISQDFPNAKRLRRARESARSLVEWYRDKLDGMMIGRTLTMQENVTDNIVSHKRDQYTVVDEDVFEQKFY